MAASGQNGKRLDTAITMTIECPLAIVSRTFTTTTIKVKISGLGAGTVSISGPGLKTTRRTITSATTATLTAKLTTQGKRLRKTKQDVRVKVSFTPKNTKITRIAWAPARARPTRRARPWSSSSPARTRRPILLRLVDALPTTAAARSGDRATTLALDLGA